jgi:hypothetical protein
MTDEKTYHSVTPEKLPIVLVILLALLIFVPIEFSVRAGSFSMPWYRIFLFLIAIPVLSRVFSGQIRLRSFDWWMIIFVLWVCFCELIKRGLGGIQPTGTFIAEALVPYFLIRTYFTNFGYFVSFANMLFKMCCVAILLAIPETFIVKTHFIHDFARQVTGYNYNPQADFRFGLFRAASFFEHAILYGLFCSFTFGLVWSSQKPNLKQRFRGIILLVGVATSLSSAPILVAIIQIATIIAERVTRLIRHRVKILMAFSAFTYVFLEVFSNRGPIGIIATSLALNPQTGYFRILIWEHGIDDVLRSPIVGIIPGEWTRPHWMPVSVDNHWLLQAMIGGIPSVIMFFLVIGLIWAALYKKMSLPLEVARLRFGWSITMFAFILGGSTVAYYGKVEPFVYLIIGYAAALSQCIATQSTDTRQSPPEDNAAPKLKPFPKRLTDPK